MNTIRRNKGIALGIVASLLFALIVTIVFSVGNIGTAYAAGNLKTR